MKHSLNTKDLELLSQFSDRPVTQADVNKPFSKLGLEPSSLDAVDLAIRLGKDYGVNISDEEFKTHNTPKKLFSLVKNKSETTKSASASERLQKFYDTRGNDQKASLAAGATLTTAGAQLVRPAMLLSEASDTKNHGKFIANYIEGNSKGSNSLLGRGYAAYVQRGAKGSNMSFDQLHHKEFSRKNPMKTLKFWGDVEALGKPSGRLDAASKNLFKEMGNTETGRIRRFALKQSIRPDLKPKDMSEADWMLDRYSKGRIPK